MSKARWQSLLKCFYVLPVGSFVMWLVAIVYYGGHRPHTPQPESAQIVLLPWTHPAVYGSADDASLLHWLFFSILAFLGLASAIHVYIVPRIATPRQRSQNRVS